ncbi:MAG: glycosyltransferase family 1 protein, partial [Saprospiraceae bacterium]|nr:glycosyltransferase family 1 protein [Saprospiraceae bacterium]
MLKKVKVAFFAEILIEDFDGASRTMFQLIHRIPADRFEFLFFCGLGPETIAGFECVRIPAMTIPFNKTYKMAIPWFSGHRLRKKLQDFQPDVIHIATPSLLGEFALKYANQQKIPVLTIYHTHFISYIDYYLKSSPRLAGFIRGLIAKSQHSFYDRCDRVYVPSAEMQSALLGWNVAPHRLQLWQRGMDTQLFSPLKKDRALVQKLVGNDRPVVLFASRLVWEKNLETLCNIYQLSQDRNLPYNFLVVGDGVALEACQRRMPKAIFTGKVDHEHLSVLYASSNVFLFPSISESYGNVVIEAMASGLPCVIADGGGSRNFIQQGKNGFLCPPNQADDYLDKITRILQDAGL